MKKLLYLGSGCFIEGHIVSPCKVTHDRGQLQGWTAEKLGSFCVFKRSQSQTMHSSIELEVDGPAIGLVSFSPRQGHTHVFE